MDMVFSTCATISFDGATGTGCSINVAYNTQIPLCRPSGFSLAGAGLAAPEKCRPIGDLCIADDNWGYNLTQSSDNDAFVRIPLTGIIEGGSLALQDKSFTPHIHIPINIGAYNLDGNPDLLVLTRSYSGGIIGIGKEEQTGVALLESIRCAAGNVGCTDSNIKKGRRDFKRVVSETGPLDEIIDARGASFIDIDEDVSRSRLCFVSLLTIDSQGTLDIMIQRKGTQRTDLGRGGSKLTFVQNNFYHDAFFLKALGPFHLIHYQWHRTDIRLLSVECSVQGDCVLNGQ